MAQIASVLSVGTVLSAYGLYFLGREGGLHVRQKYLRRSLSQKCRGGLYAREGVIMEFHDTKDAKFFRRLIFVTRNSCLWCLLMP